MDEDSKDITRSAHDVAEIADMVKRLAIDPSRSRDWKLLVVESRRRSFRESAIGELLDYSYSEWARWSCGGRTELDIHVGAVAEMVISCRRHWAKTGNLPDDPANFYSILAGMFGLRARAIFLLKEMIGRQFDSE